MNGNLLVLKKQGHSEVESIKISLESFGEENKVFYEYKKDMSKDAIANDCGGSMGVEESWSIFYKETIIPFL